MSAIFAILSQLQFCNMCIRERTTKLDYIILYALILLMILNIEGR